MLDFKTTTALVKFLLENHPATRNDDNFLYLLVTMELADRNGFDIYAINVPWFLMNINREGFIGFETVRRTRQKLQQRYPYLAPSETVKGFRTANETAYRAFARGEL